MNNIRRNPKRRNKRKSSTVIIIISILVVLFGTGSFLIYKFMPNFKVIPFYEYLMKDANKMNIVLEGDLIDIESYPTIKDKEIYIPVDFVKEYVDKHIFWDEKSKKLTITTEYKVMQMKTEELTYYVNMEPMMLNLPVYDIDGVAYLPKSLLLELYNINIEHNETSNIIIIDYKEKDKKEGVISAKKAPIRYEGFIKSPIEAYAYKEDKVYIYGEEEDYYYIRTNDGLLGYIQKKNVDSITEQKGTLKEEEVPDLKPVKQIEGKVNLVWEEIENVEQNSREASRKTHIGLDVLSPTWFTFDREAYNGEIISIADIGYVNWAHDNGYQVWPRLYDSEDGEVTAQIFSSTEKREYVIKQILGYVSLYKLDGINIDFERVREEDVGYFHQFLRELTPMLKEQGVVLSVDVFVPRAWSMYYDRGAIANIVDYVCVMTYDENTYGDTPGPNASIPFVEEGLISTLKEVPAEKLLMCIPFYTRVWIEHIEGGEMKYKIRSLGMNYAYKIFTENGAEFEWDEELGSYYGEFTIFEDGFEKTYKTWLEDERSIERKLDLLDKYNLAGTAAWVRDLEKEEIWGILNERLKEAYRQP